MNVQRPRGLLSLCLANLLALLAAAGAATLYASWLDASQFAHWAAALAVARAGLLLLDGGLKTALVRRADVPDAATLKQLVQWCTALACLLTAALAATAWTFWHAGRWMGGDAILLAAYPAAYWLSCPPLFAALARMERAQRFGAIGRAEGCSVLVEFVLPAGLMAGGCAAWLAFSLAAVSARGLRSLWIVVAARAADEAGDDGAGNRTGAGAMLREGLGVQLVAAASMLRDQMHLWLLAPWFGAAWAGQYALALTACAVLGQALVQTASRVALPRLQATDAATRWPAVLAQTRLLAVCTLPPLVFLPAWLAHADAVWWDGRWHAAVSLVPWLAARLVAGVATTTLGAWLLVARGPWSSARTHATWTGYEIAAAALALWLLGPAGLAVAGALVVWVGLCLLLAGAEPGADWWPRCRQLIALLLLRPSVAAAGLLALWAHADNAALLPATLALPLAWLTEPGVRRWLARWATRSALAIA